MAAISAVNAARPSGRIWPAPTSEEWQPPLVLSSRQTMSETPTRDFWLSCGHHLLDRDSAGHLQLTDEFLKVYIARPELTPPTEACAAERALHTTLLADPRAQISAATVAAIVDADARENWQMMLAFRDHLIAHRTLEAAYIDLVRRNLSFPPLFLNQLVHVILRNALDACDDPFVLRAAELFFRVQRMTLHEGSLLAADEETISGVGGAPASPLVSMLGIPPAAAIDVLNDVNADKYWDRSDQFDFALDLTAGRRGVAALGEVLTQWIAHLLAIDTEIEPLIEMQGVDLTWYVGLDIEATRIGDLLWNGDELDDTTAARVVGLYRLTFREPHIMMDDVQGEPVYLILAMNAESILRMKPQNLVTGLPIKHLEAAT
jgi:hypothetical protein